MFASLWQSIKADFKQLRSAPAGERFRAFKIYKLEKLDRERSNRWLSISGACGLIVFGLAIGWLPGPGGFLAIVGAAMLVPHAPGMDRMLDNSEIFVRRVSQVVQQVLRPSSVVEVAKLPVHSEQWKLPNFLFAVNP